MTTHNVTGHTRRQLKKYKIISAFAVLGLALAGWMFQTAYVQHIELLNAGDAVGQKLLRNGMPQGHQEGRP